MLEISKIAEQLQAGKEGQFGKDMSEQSRRAIREGKIPDPQEGQPDKAMSEESRRAIQEGKIPDPHEGQMPDEKHQQEISRALLPEDYQKELDAALTDQPEDWARKLLPNEGEPVQDMPREAVKDEVSVRDASEKLTEAKISEASVDEAKTLDDKSKEVYEKANVDVKNLRVENLAGKEHQFHILNDIDPNLIGPNGETNLEKMKKGNAPYALREGKLEKVELHHHGQNNDGVLVELDKKTHNNNESVLHPNQNKDEGRGDDPDWNQKRKEHWEKRAGDFVS